MLGRRQLIGILAGAAAALSAMRVEARRRRVRTAATSPWMVRLGGAGGLRYDLDFRRGEFGAPPSAFDRQRGIRLVGTARGQVTFIGVGVPHVAGDVAVQLDQPFDIALQCAGILTVIGGPTRWACDARVTIGS